jgi:hypothetical protein
VDEFDEFEEIAALDDQAFDEQCARVKRLVEYLRGPMGYRNYKIVFRFKRGLLEQVGCSGTTSLAVDSDWRYHWMVLDVSAEAVATLSDRDLIKSVIHEFCHVTVSKMRPREQTEDQQDLEELAVDELALSHRHFADEAVAQARDEWELERKRKERAARKAAGA